MQTHRRGPRLLDIPVGGSASGADGVDNNPPDNRNSDLGDDGVPDRVEKGEVVSQGSEKGQC